MIATDWAGYLASYRVIPREFFSQYVYCTIIIIIIVHVINNISEPQQIHFK